jgi:enamine deaminase RidA (YjgF/YER057c/UK114 family)
MGSSSHELVVPLSGGHTVPPQASSMSIAAEYAISEAMSGDEPIAAVFQRLADRLAAEQAELLSVMVFGRLAAREEIDLAMHAVLGERQWPVTWVEGASCDDAPLAGLQALAIRGHPVTRVRLGKRIVGSVYEEGGMRHCLLGGLGPNSTALRPPAQTQQAFANLEAALDLAGFQLGDLVRTWFFNDAILSWYEDFNRVRSALYGEVTFRTGSLPASTGVAGRNPGGAALALAAWAVQPLEAGACAREVGSPLQCPAPAYGSAFSRAMELISRDRRRLLVSGTASIHPDGNTAWTGDARKQVNLTMEVVGAILQARGLEFGHVTRAIAYFKDPGFKPHFDAWCAARGLRELPVIAVHCDICRDDLLFEIEVDAAKTS